MKESHKDIWLKRKQLGRSRYLVLFGLLPWGLGLTVITSLIELISFQQINPVWVPARLVLFFFIGFFVANARWQAMENRFESDSQQRP
ncbi:MULTISPECIES: hypothetical protein [Paenibacillus]|uniref:Uncharacterized protein n=1 Tax=Paenibacillus whitsoniae TaxID=2496558 RepID=A0A3S0ICP0_9BACL|nr:hypothetical protein [Paenibacillus whitsoniae]RTE10041.1 hypothetical protein EJQ19_09180 [Paenibacillus whitsoniae]